MDLKLSEGYEISELKDSAQKILTATEKDFNEMKDQKWYKRIWGIVTFSQKNKKITANNISNLAQAQQLMYKIIVNLSEKNVEVFSIMEDLQDQIFRLTKNNVAFAKKVQLRLYGFKENKSLDTFNENDIRVVVSTILKLSELYTPSSNEQKEYLNNLRYYLGSPEINDDFDIECLSDYMESVKKQKTLLQIVLEYIYLYDLNFEIPNEEVEDFLNNFDVRYQKIVKNISNKINAFGHDVIINRFFAEEDEEFDEIYFVEAETVEFRDLEEFIVENKYLVSEGSQKIIENKKIIVRNNFFVEGTLQIKNCEIQIEDTASETSSFYEKILMGKNIFFLDEEASLSITNSRVISSKSNQVFFVYSSDSTTVEFTDTQFENCNNIILSDEDTILKKILLKNSTFQNCSTIMKIECIEEVGIQECKFNDCTSAFFIGAVGSEDNEIIGNIKLIDCEIKNQKGYFLKIEDGTETPLIIKDCKFEGWKYEDYLLDSVQDGDIKIMVEEDILETQFDDLEPEDYSIKLLSRYQTLGWAEISEHFERYADSESEFYELSLIRCSDTKITNCTFDGLNDRIIKFKIIQSDGEVFIKNTKFENCRPVEIDSEAFILLCNIIDQKMHKIALKYFKKQTTEILEEIPNAKLPSFEDCFSFGRFTFNNIESESLTLKHCDFQHANGVKASNIKIIQSHFNDCVGTVIKCNNDIFIDSSIFNNCNSMGRAILDNGSSMCGAFLYNGNSMWDSVLNAMGTSSQSFNLKNSDFINCKVLDFQNKTKLISTRTKNPLYITNCSFKKCTATYLTDTENIEFQNSTEIDCEFEESAI